MYIGLRHIGGIEPAKSIEINIETGNTVITEELTDLDNKVDEHFINDLKEVVNMLEQQNKSIDNLNT